jgi:hypothetical protein
MPAPASIPLLSFGLSVAGEAVERKRGLGRWAGVRSAQVRGACVCLDGDGSGGDGGDDEYDGGGDECDDEGACGRRDRGEEDAL